MTSSSRTLLEVRIWMQYTVRSTDAIVFIFRSQEKWRHACTLMLKFYVRSCSTYMQSSATEIQCSGSGFGGSVINWPPGSGFGSDSGSRSFLFYQRFKEISYKNSIYATAIYLWPFRKTNMLIRKIVRFLRLSILVTTLFPFLLYLFKRLPVLT